VQNAGRNHNIKIVNRSFENVAQLKQLGTALTNQNLIHKEIKRRLNSANAFYNMGFSRLSKQVKISMYKIIILPVVLHGCKTRSLPLGAEHSLRMFVTRVLRKIF
jgi:hypothetical protein